MKSSLNNRVLWGVAYLLLQNGYVFAQPIQLIPRQGRESLEHSQADLRFPDSRELPEFWEGTPPSVVEAYIPQLPLKLTSPLLRHLRLQVAKEPYRDLLQNPVYEKALLSLLTEGGEGEQAKEFLMETNLPEKEALFLDLQWLGGHGKKACEKIANLIRTSSRAEWKEQNIYCLYLNGEEERAKISAEVLRELNPDAAQLLNTLFDPSARPPFNQSIAQSPFLLTVWLTSKQEIPEDELNKLPSSFLALIARSDKTPPHSRLLAAEIALEQGTFTAEEFAALLAKAPETGFWGKVAHGLQTQNAKGLLSLFEQAEQDGKLALIGQVFSSSLSSIEPSSETLPLASFMIRAFLQSEKKALAKKWGSFFMREAPDEAIAVLPLLHFAFPENKWDKAQIQAWQAYENRQRPKTAPQRSYEMRRILEALAEPSGDPIKGEPSPPSWRQEKLLFDGQEAVLLDSAAESKRKGEVLLLVLTLIGETPLRELSVDRLALLLKALGKAGYKEEARSLALEFLLDKGM